MTIVFLLILTLAWLVIFFPKVIRLRRSTPLPAAESFKRRLELLAPRPREAGRWVVMPEAPGRAQKQAFRRAQARKKAVLQILLGATLVTFLAGVFVDRAWPLHLACLGTTVTYVVALIGSRRKRHEALSKIKHLPTEPMRARVEDERVQGGRG